jgi:outer membrane protein TolC
VDGASDFVEQESGPDTFGSTVRVRLSQPLLRGAGYEVSHEALVQAERDVVYALRDFERFRERYSIDVARRYYDLVQQKQSLANQRRNLEGVLFGLRQAEALHAVERISELDVLRAKRQALNAENDLIQAEEAYELALAQFRVFLGLPENNEIDVQIDAPAFVPVSYDVESAIEVALENRLDIQNARERLEDSARDVRIAENRLLPDLDLGLGVDFAGDRATAFGRQGVNEERYTASLTLELPVDRVRERHSLRAAQIADRRVRRDFDEFIDAQIVDVRSTFRELERVRQSVEIQAELIADQERNVTIAQLQYERGDVSNREVVAAQDALLEARNSLIREQVNYEIARLELLRALGILFVDEHGVFR